MKSTMTRPSVLSLEYLASSSRTLLCVACVLVIAFTLSACGGNESENATGSESPLMRMLRFVPDTADYRAYVTFGDAQAWHASWNVGRIDSLEALKELEREPAAYWTNILPRQTAPPSSLGTQYLLVDDQRGAYGFDLFNLDRYLSAGNPPDWITAVEFSFDQDQISQALTAFGYSAQELEEGGTMYSLRADYEMYLNSPTRSGSTGDLNRIALLDGQMVIAKATANTTKALAAYNNQTRSLAENSDFVAAATALQDPMLDGTGDLVGVILMETGAAFADPTVILGAPTNREGLEQLESQYAAMPPLPGHKLAAFATRHRKGVTSLILIVVFPHGTDKDAAADALAQRLQSYTSLVTRAPLDERWSFQDSLSLDVNGTPVALVVMHASDPAPTSADARLVNTGLHAWVDMVVRRDLGFLTIGP